MENRSKPSPTEKHPLLDSGLVFNNRRITEIAKPFGALMSHKQKTLSELVELQDSELMLFSAVSFRISSGEKTKEMYKQTVA